MLAKSYNSNSIRMITIHCLITICLICLKLTNSNPIPNEILKLGQYSQYQEKIEDMDVDQQRALIKQFIQYAQHENLLKPENTDSTSYESFEQFRTENMDEINDAYVMSEDICQSLNLQSEQCYEDCIPYVSPLGMLTDNGTIINIDNSTTFEEVFKVLGWYQMGGDPLGWYATGNPDMCAYQDGTYCFTPIRLDAGFFSMNLQEHGCCVPGSCVGEDAEKVLKENAWCYGGYETVYAELMFQGAIPITNVCEPIPRDLTSAGFGIVVAIFCIFLLAVLVASYRTQLAMEQEERNREISNMQLLAEHAYNNNQLHDINEDQAHSPRKAVVKERNVWDDDWFLYSFSIQNLWKMFTRRRPADKSQFNFLDGIRVYSMSWVIWGHVYVSYLMSSPSNQAVLLPFMTDAKQYDYVFTQFYMMIAEYGFYSVDSFFYLSGFLAAFGIYRQLQRYSGNKALKLWYQWVPLAIVNRILRLWPMMAFILFVQWFIADQLPYGYYVASRETNSELCKDTWYSVLLFYNNLLPDMDDLGCMGHLWYIQVDIQLFLLLPFILLIFQWNRIYGMISAFIPFLVGVIIRTYFAIHYHFSANFLYPANATVNGGDQQQQYFKPWTRMSVYYFGVFTMLVILYLREKKTFIIRSRWIYLGLISFSGFIMCALVFWPYEDVKDAPTERWGLASNQVYYALSRPAWGVALGLLSFTLVFKSKIMKSIIGTLLSAEIYQPLGKLTYTMYLIHMMILGWYFADLNTSTYYEFWDVIAIFCAIWLVTMFLTIVLWFVMEQPIANMIGLAMKALMKALSGKRPKKDSADSELMKMKKTVITMGKKQQNTNGHSAKDKLLTTDRSISASQTASYGMGTGNYESFMEANNNGGEFSSIKSSNS